MTIEIREENLETICDERDALRAEVERLQARVAQLEEALRTRGGHAPTCRFCRLSYEYSKGRGPHPDESDCSCEYGAALSGSSDSWLQEHDAEVRRAALEELLAGLCLATECGGHCGFSGFRGCAAVKNAVKEALAAPSEREPGEVKP